MPMSPHIGDRELEKFIETDDGDTAVRTVSVLMDEDGDEVEVSDLGAVSTSDQNLKEILCEALIELKIANMHLSELTGMDLTKKDL